MIIPDPSSNKSSQIDPEQAHSELPTLQSSEKKAILKDRFILDMAKYILQNGGPDSDGYPHPMPKRVNVQVLREALIEAQKEGLSPEWQPYHFKGHIGTYTIPEYVDKIVLTKVDTVLHGDKFKGDLFRLLTEATAEDLFSDLEQSICGKHAKVSIGYVAKKFHDSPFSFLEHYRNLKGISGYEELKPYHMKKIPHGSFNDPALLDEVVKKKGAELLSRDKFKGNIFSLLTEVTRDDLKTPIYDKIDGHIAEIGMDNLMHYLKDSPFRFSQQYCKASGLSEYSELRPYHMQTSATRGTFEDSVFTDELIVKKLDSLLQTKFEGKLERLITETTREDLLAPLIDKVGEQEVEVSMHRAVNRYKDAIYPIICRYRDIKELPGLEDLKPYHMQSRTSRGSYRNEDILDEVWIKKIESLLKTPKYGGDFAKLKEEATYQELVSSFHDRLGDFSIEVSMSRPMAQINHSKEKAFEIYERKKLNKL